VRKKQEGCEAAERLQKLRAHRGLVELKLGAERSLGVHHARDHVQAGAQVHAVFHHFAVVLQRRFVGVGVAGLARLAVRLEQTDPRVRGPLVPAQGGCLGRGV